MAISEALDLAATKTWRHGDDWLPTKKRESNCWEIHSQVSHDDLFIDAHINALLDILELRKEQIQELQNRGYTTGINCVGYYYDEHPGFGLSVEQLARLSTLGLSVAFDLYCLCKNENE